MSINRVKARCSIALDLNKAREAVYGELANSRRALYHGIKPAHQELRDHLARYRELRRAHWRARGDSRAYIRHNLGEE